MPYLHNRYSSLLVNINRTVLNTVHIKGEECDYSGQIFHSVMHKTGQCIFYRMYNDLKVRNIGKVYFHFYTVWMMVCTTQICMRSRSAGSVTIRAAVIGWALVRWWHRKGWSNVTQMSGPYGEKLTPRRIGHHEFTVWYGKEGRAWRLLTDLWWRGKCQAFNSLLTVWAQCRQRQNRFIFVTSFLTLWRIYWLNWRMIKKKNHTEHIKVTFFSHLPASQRNRINDTELFDI